MVGLSKSLDAIAVWFAGANGAPLGTDTNPLYVTGGTGGGGSGGVVTQPTASNLNAQVVGNVASGAADAGNPIKIGGVVSSAVPTALTAGQRTDAWYSLNGAQIVGGVSVTGGDGIANANLQMFANSSGTGTTMRPSGVANYHFNGTTWDRQRGDLFGTYMTQRPSGGTNLSGSATTTSGGFNIPANTARHPGDVQGQNVSAVNIGFNEFGGTAAIGSAGTYTVPPGGTFVITTTAQVNFIAASGTAAVTITSI